MTTTVFDGVSIASGGTASRSHDVPKPETGRDWTYYLDGDSNSTDLDISWAVKPVGGSTFYPLDGASKTTVDATGNVAYEVDVGAASEVQVTITNNAASSTTVTLGADKCFR